MRFIHLDALRRMNQVGLALAATPAVPTIRIVIVKMVLVLVHHLAVAARYITIQDLIQGSLDLSNTELYTGEKGDILHFS